MKKMKKIVSLLLAMVMAFVMTATVTVFADNTFTLTITGTKTGHTYSVYQIFTGDISGESPNYVLSNVKYGKNYSGKTEGDPVLDSDLSAITNAEDFAKSVTVTDLAFKKVESSDNNTIIDNLPAGYYLVKDSFTSSGSKPQDAISKYILQVVGNTSVEVKSAVPASEKKVKENVKKVTGKTDTRIPTYTLPEKYNDVADYNIGDSVPFQLIGTLPSDYGDYDEYTYIFHDKMDAGLTFESTSLSVKVDETLLDSSKYTVVTSGLTDDCTFEVRFSDTKQIAKITKDSKIVIDFTAKLNKNAVIGLPGNVNESYLEFSNNPYNGGEGTGTTPLDKVIVFTYQLNVTKVDGQDKNTKLKDAQFVLLNNTQDEVAKVNDGKFTGWVADSEITKGEDGTYPTDYTLVSGEDGNFSVIGLDDGTYYLKETKAPTGYNLLTNPVEVKIIAATVNNQTWEGQAGNALNKLEISVASNSAQESEDINRGIVSTIVENNKGKSLPETGGMGTTLIYVIGAVLVLGAAVLLVAKRRTGAEK